MIPLATNRQVMTWLCMHPADASDSKRKRMYYILFTTAVCASGLSALVSSVVFITQFISVDFAACLYAVYQVAAESAIFNAIIVAFIKRHQIVDLFTKLTEIYVTGEPIHENKFDRYLFLYLWWIYWISMDWIQRIEFNGLNFNGFNFIVLNFNLLNYALWKLDEKFSMKNWFKSTNFKSFLQMNRTLHFDISQKQTTKVNGFGCCSLNS